MTEACPFGLAPGDVDTRQCVADLSVSVVVLGHHRFLEPVVAQFPQGQSQLDRLTNGVGMVGVGHQLEAVSGPAAYGRGQFDVAFDTQAEFHLGCGESFRDDRGHFLFEDRRQVVSLAEHHPVAVGDEIITGFSAQQLVKRLRGGLAEDVPQGDVDARKTADGHPFLAVVADRVVDIVPDDVDVQRVAADQSRGDHVPEDGLVGEGEISGSEDLADSRQSLVGVHEYQVSGSLVVIALGESEFLLHVVLQDDRFDLGDAHRGWSVHVVGALAAPSQPISSGTMCPPWTSGQRRPCRSAIFCSWSIPSR